MAAPVRAETPGRLHKSPSAFRTISEVSAELDVPQHVLRFWETKFAQLRPLKRGGGRRYYRPEDVQLLTRIRELLYRDGYTIKGVQRLFRADGARADATGADGARADVAKTGPAEPSFAARPEATAEPAPAGASAGPTASPQERGRALEGLLQELLEIRDLLRRSIPDEAG